MYPILGRLPNILVYSYTVVWAAALLLTAGWLIWRTRQQPSIGRWLDPFLAATVGGLLGGRLTFIWLNQPYFTQQPEEIWAAYNGGFTYHGALLGGLLFCALWCWLTKHSFTRYITLIAPAVPLLHAAGWLACLLEGCAYGATTFISWYAADLPDSFGVYAVRYQTQLAGILLSLLVLPLLDRLFPADGRRFWLTLALLNLIHAAISLFRADEILLISTLRLDLLLAILTTLLTLIITLISTTFKPQPKKLVQ